MLDFWNSVEIVESVENGSDSLQLPLFSTKNIHRGKGRKSASGLWKVWTNFYESRVSPIFTTLPAPMVINRSPFIQLFKINFSISSKVWK